MTDSNHEIADLLHDSDILGLKAAASLEGVPRAVVMQWLLLVDSHLLGFLERYRHEPCHPAVAELFADSERAELRRIEDYYFRAGEKRARMRYMAGMVTFGVVLVAAAAVVTALVLSFFDSFSVDSTAVQEFYAAAAAGGVGAMVSVLMRMSGRGSFAIDHELSRWEVMLVGAYRPLIGSVSGIVVYFLVQTPLIPIEQTALTLPFYVVVAFLAGFIERWTRVVLSGAMRTIGEHEQRAERAAAPRTVASDVVDAASPRRRAPRRERRFTRVNGRPGLPRARPRARITGCYRRAPAIRRPRPARTGKARPGRCKPSFSPFAAKAGRRAIAGIRHTRRNPPPARVPTSRARRRDSPGGDLAKPIPREAADHEL